MRVLHISSEVGWRGGEQQLAYLLEDLFALKVKNIMAIKSGSLLHKFCTEKEVPFYELNFSNALDILSAAKIAKICRREKIDLIHLHSSKAHGAGVLSTFCGNRVPMVLSRRVAFLPGMNILSKWKYNHKQIKKILCVSEKVKQIMQQYVADRSKCITIYSGIDLNKFQSIKPDKNWIRKEFGIQSDNVIIATVGAMDVSKDHFTFVDTIEKLVGMGVKAHGIIAGSGPLAQVLSNYVHKKGLGRQITLAGQRSDVGKILTSGDVFLMTSKEEGLGTSLLDAFLARIPVVATNAGGIPEIVRHLETGLLAPVGDSGKLSENIFSLLSDELGRKKLVDNAHSFVSGFSKQETSGNTVRVYQEVLTKIV